MEGQTVKVRTCNLKTTLWPLFMNVVQLPQGQSHSEEAVRYILGIFIIVFQNLLAKTEYAKHVVRNITFSEAAGQDSNITGQTASEQVLFYLNVHLFATIVSINGIWEVGDRWGGGVYTPAAPYQYLNFEWYEMEPCTRDIPCAMMMIRNAIDYVT